MTETGNIIAAKIEAIQSLATVFDREVRTNGIANLHQARAFIATWAEALAALAPATQQATEGLNAFTTAAAQPVNPVDWDESTEPPIGSTVRDCSGDPWTRTPDGRWALRYSPDTYSVVHGHNWSYVLNYGPLTLENWAS